MKCLKTALVQQRAIPNNSDRNLELGLEYIRQASKMGADIVLFPEMWSSGYAYPFEGALEADSPFIIAFREIARELKIGVVITYLSKGIKKPRNSAVVIDRSGNILLNYSKVHTCDFADEGDLEHGSTFSVCEFDGVKIGVMICFDREFPESARVLMLKGAEIILVPNACDMNPARLQQLSTRAFENMVGIAMANYPAKKWGASCAFSPVVFDKDGNYADNTIVLQKDVTEKIILAEFDMDKIRDYRRREVWGDKYRKLEAYEGLANETIENKLLD